MLRRKQAPARSAFLPVRRAPSIAAALSIVSTPRTRAPGTARRQARWWAGLCDRPIRWARSDRQDSVPGVPDRARSDRQDTVPGVPARPQSDRQNTVPGVPGPPRSGRDSIARTLFQVFQAHPSRAATDPRPMPSIDRFAARPAGPAARTKNPALHGSAGLSVPEAGRVGAAISAAATARPAGSGWPGSASRWRPGSGSAPWPARWSRSNNRRPRSASGRRPGW